MSSYWKIIVRSIKGSFARFMAILAIIALGVGFFAGLSLTMPCFLATGDKYIKDHNLFDFRLISTIGFNDDDISKIAAIDGVKYAEGAYFQDAISNVSSGTSILLDSKVIRFHSMMDNINTLRLEAGRLPQAGNEIVIDGYRCSPDMIGSKITILDTNESSALENFKYTEYTVVGIIRSPYYMNFQLGTTNVGNGSLAFYAYIPESGFDMEYYNEAYVYYDTEFFIYDDQYDEFVENTEDGLKNQVEAIIDARFDELISDSKTELNDALTEANDELKDAWLELSDAQAELNDAMTEIEDGKTELDDAWQALLDAQDELDKARAEIDANIALLNNNEAELNDKASEVNAGIVEANAVKADLESQLTEVNATIDEINIQIATIDETLPQIIMMEEAGMELPEGTPSSAELTAAKAALEAGLVEATAGKDALEAGIIQVDATLDELNGYLAQINEGYAQIAAGRAQIEEAQAVLASGESKYNQGVLDYEEGLAEYNDGVATYEDGRTEYIDGLGKYNDTVASIYRYFYYLSNKIDSVEEPDVYVLGRDTNIGYVCFENDAQIVKGIANVFPLFFFGLAALVCSTTMQRMVSDERSEIGTMRALGYSEFAIIMKYVIYSGTASLIGCIGGYLVGIKVFPGIIWMVYRIMYGFAPIVYVNKISIFILVLAVSLLCSVGVTVVTAVSELKGMPAELIRPKAPVAGKRILLERIGFIWNKLKFTYKVSIRNVFRFKKRMWMMIIGIAGSTALLFAAFGIRDSINDVVNYEYDRILPYQLSVTYKDGTSEDEIRNNVLEANAYFGVDAKCVLTRNENITHNGDAIRDVNLIVTEDPDISEAVCGYVDGNLMAWPGDGEVAISSKLALKNGLSAGDMITFGYGDDGEEFTVRIAYVFENYTFHYALMNGSTYEECFGEEYSPNTSLIVRHDDASEEATGVTDNDYGRYISEADNIRSWSVIKDSRESFGETIKQLNSIVILVIGCAAALAFIVLFNLNNINITERIREIATIKVLGFFKNETGSYMFRENVILVVMGFIVGIPLGIVFHSFIMDQIEMDIVTFCVQIYPISYLYALGFIVLFSVIVDMAMRVKINKVDMAESLKSIE